MCQHLNIGQESVEEVRQRLGLVVRRAKEYSTSLRAVFTDSYAREALMYIRLNEHTRTNELDGHGGTPMESGEAVWRATEQALPPVREQEKSWREQVHVDTGSAQNGDASFSKAPAAVTKLRKKIYVGSFGLENDKGEGS